METKGGKQQPSVKCFNTHGKYFWIQFHKHITYFYEKLPSNAKLHEEQKEKPCKHQLHNRGDASHSDVGSILNLEENVSQT